MYKEMDREVKKDAEEEMNCILDLLEEWCLKYDQDYANAVVLVKHDQIYRGRNVYLQGAI